MSDANILFFPHSGFIVLYLNLDLIHHQPIVILSINMLCLIKPPMTSAFLILFI